ncbi:UDP-N-acetylmuramoylalanyl-D-glutamate--2,6-diaminopimelate ligase [Alkalihalobacillus alcalophilus ATCC 27647 = CGMCC 1.3604]|uniref:UDP-N-acetylmuramoylalanyl-D-glutamate--2, 6-diaminopimelate ligase n=1 Tax=Alkalihalobacillus alcalophilus ATCC 27647 = CGMCC 1.3604 TaxID=1218173 RepID=A0A094WKS5_ALKAL|nr:UDP-N-acetylmuramoyl-L-alanyl-D-glutamate--2,6-diaminopimelate ligase [Alkalihalobacillus alcalophilus]KGA96553.1 hypothetical protein BALCAV_0215570 [Alkalihalobacillus alcalophilus ATCC 27647 = CGMCC 1.3604]MED1564139.1 UDP-N-acetylmuramoyl-L-alanyl-D-glutamate--2,6-diaminopimelate ligase [Alkalihalobacillus alcalophilus]THG91850.1 UDP-N-acetylmuramoylalanyl-D-glutamate--2,6-diaminopimelate ligase [Alkalihalobacillus alcalophilus ATCC 27647 = CGMCC 1.3604]
MKLPLLLQELNMIVNEPSLNDIEVTGLHFHSKKVEPGFLFVAISGFEQDGHDYIAEACERGAVAVLGEAKSIQIDIPYYSVPDSRRALSRLSAAFYQFPTNKHKVIGITGTNGKTTTSYMLKHILTEAGRTCSLISSVSHEINGETRPSHVTTPDAITIQKLLAESEDEYVILEVSSHGLDQGRVSDVFFDYALFTNLSHDHLNYHPTIEHYFASKVKLFDQLKPNGEAIVATFTEIWSERLVAYVKKQHKKVTTVGPQHHNDIVSSYENEFSTLFELSKFDMEISFELPVIGVHQNRNALLAYATAEKCGVTPKEIKKALSQFPEVPGRFQQMKLPKDSTAVIDYAHSPESIDACLKTIKMYKPNRLFHVFGFRGDSDVTKREAMLEHSFQHSDQIFLTFDDLNGVSEEEMYQTLLKLNESIDNQAIIINDRTEAIKHAYSEMEKGDWLVITGKGHEKYKQVFNLPSKNDQETLQYLKEGQCK